MTAVFSSDMKAEENGTLSLKCWENIIVIQELLWQQNNCPTEVLLREKFIDLTAYIRKEVKSQINNFIKPLARKTNI